MSVHDQPPGLLPSTALPADWYRWTPDVPTVIYHGDKEKRAELRREFLRPQTKQRDVNYPIIITSYEIIMSDAKFMKHVKWDYLVVDEGHRLKNCNCRLIRELKTLNADNRLLLTGTPLQVSTSSWVNPPFSSRTMATTRIN